MTVLLTSHDAGDIEQVCQRVIVINHGTIVFDDSVAALKSSFLRHKVIDLKLSAPSAPIAWTNVPALKVVEAQPYRIRFEVDTREMSTERVIGELGARYQIADLTIEEPPLEEVIAAIYASTTRETSPTGGTS